MDTLDNENAKNAFFSFFGQKKCGSAKKIWKKSGKGRNTA
jgi:hypothetical protein